MAEIERIGTHKSLQALVGRPAQDFVRHRGDMCLLDRLEKVNAEMAACSWTCSQSSPFFDPVCGIPAWLGIEFMAQCIAVHAGALASTRGFKPPLGYLLGTRHFQCTTSRFDTGQRHMVSCQELLRHDDGLGAYQCYVHLGNELLAEAKLTVLERESGEPLYGD